MIASKFYKKTVIEFPRSTLAVLFVVLLIFGYFTKFFQLDASSDTLLLENDPDLKYLREVNKKYGSKDFLVLTYTHSPRENLNFKSEATIKNLELLNGNYLIIKSATRSNMEFFGSQITAVTWKTMKIQKFQ